MHRDVTLVAIKSSNKLKYLKLEERELKTAKKLLYSFKRSFQLGDKKFCVIYTLKQFASSLWIKGLDNQLASSLLATCSRLVIIKPEQAMRTHPDIGMMTAR